MKKCVRNFYEILQWQSTRNEAKEFFVWTQMFHVPTRKEQIYNKKFSIAYIVRMIFILENEFNDSHVYIRICISRNDQEMFKHESHDTGVT